MTVLALRRRPSRALEDKLEGIFSHLTCDASELAKALLLPQAKELYELLHPETKHGGSRQDLNLRSWPAFADYVSARTGLSRSTVHRRLDDGERLHALDQDAASACYGTALANQLRVVVRIAAIPKPEVQRDLVSIYVRGAGRKAAQEELVKWEEEFGLREKPMKPADRESRSLDEEIDKLRGFVQDDDEAGTVDSPDEAPEASDSDVLGKIMTLLGVQCADDCIQKLSELIERQKVAEGFEEEKEDEADEADEDSNQPQVF